MAKVSVAQGIDEALFCFFKLIFDLCFFVLRVLRQTHRSGPHFWFGGLVSRFDLEVWFGGLEAIDQKVWKKIDGRRLGLQKWVELCCAVLRLILLVLCARCPKPDRSRARFPVSFPQKCRFEIWMVCSVLSWSALFDTLPSQRQLVPPSAPPRPLPPDSLQLLLSHTATK